MALVWPSPSLLSAHLDLPDYYLALQRPRQRRPVRRRAQLSQRPSSSSFVEAPVSARLKGSDHGDLVLNPFKTGGEGDSPLGQAGGGS